MRIADALGDGDMVEVQAGKVARVGVVPETEVDRVCAVIDGGLQRGQAAGRTDQLRQSVHGRH
jgi:hypothetical protein